ncbi:MAG TPA: ABC transporter permease [Syntrophomonas sp.]|nr:ABC transporter permease [Syntrophomonas sp.]
MIIKIKNILGSKDQFSNGSFFSKYGLILITLIATIIFSLYSPYFLRMGNWSALIVGQVGVCCVALAGITPLIAGEFDFSIGYMLGLCAMVGAKVAQMTTSTVIVILAVIGTGLLAGLANGVFVSVLRLNSTVITLGMGLVFYGFMLGISGGRTITGNIPVILKTIAQVRLLNINISVWILVVLSLVLFYLLEHTPFGKHMYATGQSERVAFLSGINTRLLKCLSFIFAGFFISVGALIFLGQQGSAMPATGPSYLLPAYAVVFLSITTHRQGEYNVPGLMLSVLMLAVCFNGLSLIGVPFWTESVFNGIILLAAILTMRKDARNIKIS